MRRLLIAQRRDWADAGTWREDKSPARPLSPPVRRLDAAAATNATAKALVCASSTR
jgi:hypothetical protein